MVRAVAMRRATVFVLSPAEERSSFRAHRWYLDVEVDAIEERTRDERQEVARVSEVTARA